MPNYKAPTYYDPATNRINTSSTTTEITDADSPYDVLATDTTISVDSSANPVTINLPQISSDSAHRILIIKDSGGLAGTNNITLTPFGADTIDGGASVTLAVNFNCITLLSDGTGDWFVVSLY